MTHILHKKIGDCAFWVKKDISYKLAEKYAVEGDRAEDEPIKNAVINSVSTFGLVF
ncbi:hypothetical protein YPPY66_1700 [Yersinia pestis PY-66]|uniref:Uncharacterized protein n=2 Tax=Yersinia pestis TaxID=632 RepID=A0AAV3BIB6_YERPE|nr:hypothetical protein YPC_2921 [Yersinia pestis biovar Medievalis str. Harbin 35]EDR34396.1 hypothetical protein YPIP275_4775 [Yersinia pestis biovar Orientalis str. IP275]EDR43554.1 hypothetical protein YpE1979001_2528 [Yersinia pestis biovar Antiqua str. E1979001]EDR51692.1 hypothetical protein YpB42003004_2293 [Yersinia pestis biovar Antiqua str. B42003004]EDR58523.1 hypothetical protein YpMG051020_0654 [Yersinia pestis biovar Orientalis str. MG05-1020]EDR61607.1 hypothetical protein YpUG